jgi:ribulose-phosphate 3-epimerase
MTVNPGFGGQVFIDSSLNKIKLVKELINNKPIKIQVDGGINKVVAPRVIDAGANVIVAGSAVFNGGNVESYSKNINALRYKI